MIEAIIYKFVLTAFVVVFLFGIDLTFMVAAVIFGNVFQLLDLITCGRVSSDWYDKLVNMSFQAVFGMDTNDIEGFRKARAIS